MSAIALGEISREVCDTLQRKDNDDIINDDECSADSNFDKWWRVWHTRRRINKTTRAPSEVGVERKIKEARNAVRD